MKPIALSIIEVTPYKYWEMGVMCQCGAVQSHPVSPKIGEAGIIKVWCAHCDTVLELNLAGMKPGSLHFG